MEIKFFQGRLNFFKEIEIFQRMRFLGRLKFFRGEGGGVLMFSVIFL